MKSPSSQSDAVEAALSDAMPRSPDKENELHQGQRSEGDGYLSVATRIESAGGLRILQSSAGLLALAMMCLIVYASLYPFDEWRNQNISPFKFLSAPLPKYWTGFDIVANVVGYMPIGFLLALSMLRSYRSTWAVTKAVLVAAVLSLMMETLQSYLPSRIPSNLDMALNTAGAWSGACIAWGIQKMGFVDRWRRFRARWFAHDARGALALLVLWPVALLFPASVPMGLGQVFERLEAALSEALTDSPFLEWLPMREIELQPLVPLSELVCVALGALIPCLLAYSVIRTVWQRAAFAGLMLTAGVAASALSAALSYGPEHAWAWLDVPVQAGLALAVVLAALLLPVRRRGAAAFALLALAIHLVLLNQAQSSPYFAQTLQTWERGRFIRFHGVVQWLGWLWPYAALLYVLARAAGRERAPFLTSDIENVKLSP